MDPRLAFTLANASPSDRAQMMQAATENAYPAAGANLPAPPGAGFAGALPGVPAPFNAGGLDVAGADLTDPNDPAGQMPGEPLDDGYEPDPTDLTRVNYADYRVQMDADERLHLGRTIREEIDRYQSATQNRRDNLKQWRSDWKVEPVESTRWEGAAEVNSPMTRIYSQTHASRLDGQILMVSPPLTCVARKPEAIEAQPVIEECVTAKLEEADFATHGSEAHQELAVAGNVFVTVSFDEEIRRCPEVLVDFDEAVFQSLLQAGVNRVIAYGQAVKKDRDGRPVAELNFKDRLVYSGPKFRTIRWEDGIILPAHITHPSQRRAIGERMMLTGAELEAGVALGKYIEEEVEEILKRTSDSLPDDLAETRDSQGIDPDPETEPVDGHESSDGRYYLCYEMCWLRDWNDDGREEWAVVTIHYETGRILRCHYLPYEHGEPYYHLLRYITSTGELWGQGIAEMVAVFHDADAALWNAWIDGLDLALNMRGNFYYKKGSFDPSTVNFELGRPIPVNNLDDIKPMQLPSLPGDLLAARSFLKDATDLLTATSSPTMGKESEGDKTLGELKILVGASNQLAEINASRVARQWCPVWDQFRLLLAQFGEGGTVMYRKAAEPELNIDNGDGTRLPAAMIQGQMVPAPGGVAFGEIDAQMLRADVDLMPTGLTQRGDAQSRMQLAQIVLQTIMTNPLTQGMLDVQQLALGTFLSEIQYQQHEKMMRMVADNLAAAAIAAQNAAREKATRDALGAAAGVASGTIDGQRQAEEANAADATRNSQTALQQAQAQQLQAGPPAPPAPSLSAP